MTDSIESIRKSARHFFSGTLLSRISGMARDMSMAYAFGTDPAIAAFMVAFRFAHILRRLFGEGALQSAFIPTYEAIKCEDKERAIHFFRDLTRVLSLFLICLIVCGISVLFGFQCFFEMHSECKSILLLTAIMLPSLLFICLFGLNASFLQCEKNYFMPAMAPVAFNGVWIATVLAFQDMPAHEAVPWLSFGVVVACFAQWFLTCRNTWTHTSFRLSFSVSSDLKKLAKPLLLGIFGVSATQINSGVDTLFAAFADPQGPAFLWYAMRLEQLPLALFGIAVAGAILPPLSRALKEGRKEDFGHFLKDAFYRTWNFMMCLTVFVIIWGDEVVTLLYKRGDFSESAVIHTTQCLWGYGLGLIPSALILVLAPACYARREYSFPTLASIIALILNGVLNGLFIGYFSFGAESVALATSISAWVNLIFLWRVIHKSGVSILSIEDTKQVISAFISLSLAACGTLIYRAYLGFSVFSSHLFQASLIEQLLFLLIQIVLFGMIFFGIKSVLSFFGLKFKLS